MGQAWRQFDAMVRERGQALRRMAFDELAARRPAAPERVRLGRRAGEIAVYCELRGSDCVAVAVRGEFTTWLPAVKRVARDGFYKHRDGAVAEMGVHEQYDFDPLFPR